MEELNNRKRIEVKKFAPSQDTRESEKENLISNYSPEIPEKVKVTQKVLDPPIPCINEIEPFSIS